jgi:hypothetical protein
VKIQFEDKSYLEIKKSSNTNKVTIIIQAKDHQNSLKKITNCVEIDLDQFKKIINEIVS